MTHVDPPPGPPYRWSSREVVTTETIHAGHSPHGWIEIRDTGETVFNDDEEWPVFRWEASREGLVVKGSSRSLARAKEDAGTVLRLLAHCDIERVW